MRGCGSTRRLRDRWVDCCAGLQMVWVALELKREKSSISGGSFCCKWLTQSCGNHGFWHTFSFCFFLLLHFLQVPRSWSLWFCCTGVSLFSGLRAYLWQQDSMAGIWESVLVCSESCVTRNWSIGAFQLSFRNSADFHAMKTLEYGRLLPL